MATAASPAGSAVRFAVQAGPLTRARLAHRTAEADHRGLSLPAVCSEAELLHLRLIQKALLGDATWEDAVAAIRGDQP